jgi:DNA polymerase-3 subunit delta
MGQLLFIYGDEPFLAEEAVRDIQKKSGEYQLFEGQFDMGKIEHALLNTTLFGFSTTLILKSPWFLTKALTDIEVKQIQDLFASVPASPHTVVIWAAEKIDQRKKLVAYLKKNAQATEFVSFKDWEQDKIVRWIQQRMGTLGKTIEPKAALALEQLGGTDLRFLSNELEKLHVYTGEQTRITFEDVHAVSSGAVGRIFQLSEALKARQLGNALEALTRLFDSNEEPIKLFGFIVSTLRLYLQILCVMERGESIQDMAQTLGKNPYYLKQLVPAVKKSFTRDKLQSVFLMLRDKDVAIKTGQIAPKTALELAIVEVCA